MIDEIDDLTRRAKSAMTRDCAVSLAREAVMRKFVVGHYSDVIQIMDDKTRDQLAEILLRETP